MIVAERTRRVICRSSFLALCVAPTLIVVAWVIVARLPTERHRIEAALSARLGAEVTLGSVGYPRPELIRYQRIAVADPVTHTTLFRADRVDLRRESGRWTATVEGAELTSAAPGIWPMLRRCVEPLGQHAAEPLQIVAERLAISGAGEPLELAQFKARLDGSATEQAVRMTFRLAADPNHPTMRFEVVGTAKGDVAADFATANAKLPVAVLALVVPSATRLGPAATFEGRATFGRLDGPLLGKVSGELQNMDLEALCGDLLPADKSLSGSGQLTLEESRFEEGRLVRAKGYFSAGSGKIGARLLDAAIDSFHLEHKETERPATVGQFAYGQLGFEFALDEQGIKVDGYIPKQGDDGELINGPGAKGPWKLATAKDATPQPTTALARLFSPTTTDWVPATAQSHWLLGRLPLTPAGSSVPR